MRAVVLACVLAIAGPAAADDAALAPGFVWLPGFDRTTRFGLQAEEIDLRDADASYARVAFRVQYVAPQLGLGVYVRWQQYVERPLEDEPANANELGVLYAVPGSALDAPDLRLVVHAGIGGGPPVPYETTPGEGEIGGAGASILARACALYARLDLDVGFSGLTLASGRVDAGIGYVVGGIAIGAEAMWSSYEGVEPIGEPVQASRNFLGALSARYAAAEIQPYVAVMSTFDETAIGAVVGVEDRR